MSMSTFKLLDVVALTEDMPAAGLYRGQVGTIVEHLRAGIFEVEFSDDEGKSYALAAIMAEQLLRLRFEPVATC